MGRVGRIGLVGRVGRWEIPQISRRTRSRAHPTHQPHPTHSTPATLPDPPDLPDQPGPPDDPPAGAHATRPSHQPSNRRSRSSIACCFCCSPKRGRWCRPGTASIATRTPSTRSAGAAAERPHARGLWDALQAISRLAHAGCRAGDLHVTPFNGRLFSPRHTPLAERARVPDRVGAPRRPGAGDAAAADGGRRRLRYARPRRRAARRRLRARARVRTGRVATGPLRPDAHVARAQGDGQLLHAAIDDRVSGAARAPSARRAAARPTQILALRVLDPGDGQRRVSGRRLPVSRSGRRARAVAQASGRPDDDLTRAGARRCGARSRSAVLYGVDLNPMAVQLARLSLWLTTLAADRPLTFLDHHLASGDSLSARGSTTSRASRRGRRPQRRASEARAAALRRRPAERDGDACAAGSLSPRVRTRRHAGGVRDKERALASLTAPGTPLSAGRPPRICGAPAGSGRTDARRPLRDDLLASCSDQHGAALARAPVDARCSTSARRHARDAPRSSTGSSNSPRCSSIDTGAAIPTAASTPCSAIRRGTCCGRHRRRSDARAARAARRCGCASFATPASTASGRGPRQSLSALPRARAAAARPGGRVGADPSVGSRHRSAAAARCGVRCSIRCTSIASSGSTIATAIFPIHRDVQVPAADGDRPAARTDRSPAAFGLTQAAWLDGFPTRRGRSARGASDRAQPRAAGSLGSASTWRFRCSRARTISRSSCARQPRRRHRLASASGWGARFGRELNATEDRAALRDALAAPACDAGHAAGHRRQAPRTFRVVCVDRQHRRASPARDVGRARCSIARRRFDRGAARLPRRGQRHQPPHAHRRAPAGRHRLDAHGLLPEDAAGPSQPVLPARAAQQPGRELPGPAAGHDPCHHGADGAPAGAAAAGRRRASSASSPRSRARSRRPESSDTGPPTRA